MPEIEYKFALTGSIAEMSRRLTSLGFQLSKRHRERTTMFDNDEGLMRVTNGRLRLRRSGRQASMSYKKPLPNQSGGPKRETEFQIDVSSYAQAWKIIGRLGFKESSSYEKYRLAARRCDVTVTIDEYPYQTFVEIEGPPEEIRRVAGQLGFDIRSHLSEPADTLFNRWRRERGLPEKMHLRFTDYDQ